MCSAFARISTSEIDKGWFFEIDVGNYHKGRYRTNRTVEEWNTKSK